MAVSLSPPKRKAPSEAQIEATINKGGKVGAESEQTALTPTPEAEPDAAPKHVNTRLTAGIIRQIDELRARRTRRPGSPKLGISLHDWVVEAVLEKLQRETKSTGK